MSWILSFWFTFIAKLAPSSPTSHIPFLPNTCVCVCFCSDVCAKGQQRTTTAHVRRAAESRDFRWRHRRVAAASRRSVAIDEVSATSIKRDFDSAHSDAVLSIYLVIHVSLSATKFCNVVVSSTRQETERYGGFLWSACVRWSLIPYNVEFLKRRLYLEAKPVVSE